MIWAIGDIQGCHKSLRELLKKIDFDHKSDQLWIAGDLVNRGEGSLETLRYLYSIKESVVVVLGNHDITLIAAYLGIKKSNPTIDPILQAKDADLLITWLRSQPFLHVDEKLGYVMSHAGISPEFDLPMAEHYARRLQKRLQSDDYAEWLSQMFGKGLDHLDTNATEIELQRYLLASFIRMRFCYNDARLDYKQKGSPNDSTQEMGLQPWFECKIRKPIEHKIIFGHWSTLGYYNDERVCCLDTGCVWSGKMSALRLDSRARNIKKEKLVQVKCN